jgi:hypothetical protein
MSQGQKKGRDEPEKGGPVMSTRTPARSPHRLSWAEEVFVWVFALVQLYFLLAFGTQISSDDLFSSPAAIIDIWWKVDLILGVSYYVIRGAFR